MAGSSGFEEYAASATPQLVRAAYLLLGDRGLAEDLAQETLIVMFRNWRRIRAVDAAPAYAHRTVVRLARRYLHRAASRLEIVGDASSAQSVDMPDPLDLPEVVRAALLNLPKRQREALVLRYVLDQSVEGTAAAMGCRVGTVKSQTSKGLAAVRAALGNVALPQPSREPS